MLRRLHNKCRILNTEGCSTATTPAHTYGFNFEENWRFDKSTLLSWSCIPFILPLGIRRFSRICFQYSATKLVRIRRNVHQWHMFTEVRHILFERVQNDFHHRYKNSAHLCPYVHTKWTCTSNSESDLYRLSDPCYLLCSFSSLLTYWALYRCGNTLNCVSGGNASNLGRVTSFPTRFSYIILSLSRQFSSGIVPWSPLPPHFETSQSRQTLQYYGYLNVSTSSFRVLHLVF
jgi:hypothetical protein